MIRKYIYGFFLLSFLFACEKENIEVRETAIDDANSAAKTSYSSSYDHPNIEKGVIKIKLNESVGDDVSVIRQGAIVQSNITPLNALLSQLQATSMKRLFPYAGKFEQRTRRAGLHRWYVVRFNPKTSVGTAMAMAKKLKSVQIVEEQYKIKLSKYSLNTASNALPTKANPPMNDPLLNRQWHYNNTGLLDDFVKGADINLFKVWQVGVSGTSNVIVNVVDGGVDYKHEDLKDNMHINIAELNGTKGVDDDNNGCIDDIYGYNFVNNDAEIIPELHGTHVAGTVAARNNNGIGVCGVAGGDGTPNSGVRLINSQIFVGEKGGDTASAIKYGADNGAVISQNSWGYPYPGPGYLPVSEKEAIDYFVKYAGCDNNGKQLANSPMKGGVVIFAAGNDDRDFVSIPAFYKKVVAVTAMAPNFKKAWYSTYGNWADIMAPGGDELFTNGEVYSTLPDNEYGYMQGTSMACPHVSGIAALIVSKFGKQGFTNDDLKKRLLTSLRPFNIDKENPRYKGKLGVGYIDAYAALAENQNKKPEKPQFVSVTPDFVSLDIKWKAVSDEDDTLPLFYKLYFSNKQLNKSNYNKAECIQINALGYVAGTEINYIMKKLPMNTNFYFAIEAIDRWGLTSDVDFIAAKTKENHQPVITRENNTPIRLTGKAKLSVKLLVNEPDGQKWNYEVLGYQKGVTHDRTDDAVIIDFRVVKPLGKFSLQVVVTDELGAKTMVDVPFEYYKNNPPVLVKELPKLYAPVGKKQVIDLSKFIKDPEGDKLIYTAQSLTNAILGVTLEGSKLSIDPLKLGLGSIEITATDVNGASITTPILLQVVKDDIVYMAYPIPVKRHLNVVLSNEVNRAKLQVRTLTGSLVYEKNVVVKNDNRVVALDLKEVSGGTYVLYVEANNKTYKQTFIKY